MQLHSLRLKNVSLFDEVQIPIDSNSGLVVISGMNLDSNEPDNTNGAGKSLLMGSLTTPLFERTPVTDLKTKTKDKKELLKKGSEIALDFTGVNGKRYEFLQNSKGYGVVEDGKDLKVVKQEVARNYLKAAAPISEEEFYSVCYVQNTKPLQFQHCTDAQRLHFITELFGLHIFDHIRAEINKERGKIKDAGIEYETLSGQLDTAQRQAEKLKKKLVAKDKVKKSKSRKEELRGEEKILIKKAQKAEKQIVEAEEIEKLQSKLKALDKLLPKKLNHDDLKSLIRSLESYETYQKALSRYESKTEELTNQIAKVSKKISGKAPKLADVHAKLKKVAKALCKMVDLGEKYAEYHDTLEGTESEIKKVERALARFDFDYKKVTVKSLNVDVDFCRSAIKLYTHLERKAEDGTCPTCGSGVDLKVLKKGAKEANRKLKEYEQVSEAEELYAELKELKADLKAIKKDGEPKYSESKHKELEKEYDKLTDLVTYLQQLKVLNEKLELIDKPEKVKKPKTKYTIEELYGFYENSKKRKEIQIRLEAKGNLDVDLSKLEKIISACDKELESLGKEIDTLDEFITEARIVSNEYKVHVKNANRIEKKLQSSKELFDQKKLFDFLFKKYGNTDMKLQAASQVLKMLENNLNTFSSLVFVEPVEFKVAPVTGGVGAYYKMKGEEWVNISRLSGAETNCFRLLFAVSLLPLIPKERRANFIILDEPDAACSEAVRNRMIKDFLPKLRSLVPNVFWVTPKETDSFKEAEVWKVVKENGKSRVEGLQ